MFVKFDSSKVPLKISSIDHCFESETLNCSWSCHIDYKGSRKTTSVLGESIWENC